MKQMITTSRLVVSQAVALVTSFAAYLNASALDMSIRTGVVSARGNQQPADLFGQAGAFTTLSNTLLFIVGALSVIVMVIGGLRYVVSGGDSTRVAAAKNTVLYAIVGIVVALLGYGAVSFIISSFAASDGGASNAGTNI